MHQSRVALISLCQRENESDGISSVDSGIPSGVWAGDSGVVFCPPEVGALSGDEIVEVPQIQTVEKERIAAVAPPGDRHTAFQGDPQVHNAEGSTQSSDLSLWNHERLAALCKTAVAELGDPIATSREHVPTVEETQGDSQSVENMLYEVEEMLGRDADDQTDGCWLERYCRAHDVRSKLSGALDRHWGRLRAQHRTPCCLAVAATISNAVDFYCEYREWIGHAKAAKSQTARTLTKVSGRRRRRKR